ncbi:MAG TPA: phosphoglycerate mutase [Thermomonas sp.]|nr:phosphoglycerate mutase [Thermomonas sp.]
MPRLTLLLPASSRFAGVALPLPLARSMGRADLVAHESGGDAQLGRHFRLLPNRWAAAALTRVVDGGIEDACLSGWLRADPAYIRPDLNGARLLGIGDALRLDQADVDAFLPALRPLFGDAGFPLDAPHPGRWYLRLPRESKLPAFAAPAQALGEDVFEHIPDGAEARRWRVLSSEAQVALHNHPHNAARVAAGKPPINSLWFWGGGVLPDHVSATSTTVYSDDPLLQGLARVGKLAHMPLTAFDDSSTDALVDLRSQRDPRALVDAWMLPAAASAKAGQVVFDFADGRDFTIQPGQRWRFWRSPLPALDA